MKALILFLTICSIYLNDQIAAVSFKSENDISQTFMKYVTNTLDNSELEEFKTLIEILSPPSYIIRDSLLSYSQGRQSLICIGCRAALNTFLDLHKDGASDELLAEIATDLCVLLEIQPPNVCRGLIKLNLPIFLYIIDHEPRFNSETFCGVLLQSRNKNTCPYDDKRFEWSINLPKKTSTKKLSKSSNPNFNIMQITDIHYDPSYKANGLSACNEPICCREGQEEPESNKWTRMYDEDLLEDKVYVENGTIFLDVDCVDEIRMLKEKRQTRAMDQKKNTQAGHWGDYNHCDLPWWSFEDAIDHMADTHKNTEYIYYTGDTIDHGVWETTTSAISRSLNKTLDKFEKAFGSIPVFPIIGNHESQPLNQFAPPQVVNPKYSTSWLYKLLAEKWSKWLPADTKHSILMGGYYTVLVRPGFRIIALNTNICYVYNWWIHLDPVDPGKQLHWLTETLFNAEKSGERVHILSHIPAGLIDCYYTYNREYRKIIDRFADIITAEFNGHTHKDEFKIYYEKKNISNPILVGWNSGSLTPYSNVNPNYRVYEVNGNNYDIVNYDHWVYNLTEANLTPHIRPKWYKEYSFKEYYKVDSLSAPDVDKLVSRMVTSEKDLLINDYHIFRGKSSDPYIQKQCDKKCVNENLCYMTTTELYDERKCEILWDIMQL